LKKKIVLLLIFSLFLSMSFPKQNWSPALFGQIGFAAAHTSTMAAGEAVVLDPTAKSLQVGSGETGRLVTNDLVSPSYTSLSTSANTTLSEGADAPLTSHTTSAGFGVSEGSVDFLDCSVLKIDDDPTSDKVYSNRYAIKITLPFETSIAGFAVDITPTIREDINFYVKTGLSGTILTQGVISGYIASSAHTTNQLLYVPFSYSGASSPVTLQASTSYYFILEPSSSTSDTFFELRQSADNPDDLTLYNWWDSNYELLYTDVNFHLLTTVTTIADNVPVSSAGYTSTTWTAVQQGDHALLAWYERSAFYAESYGSLEMEVIASQELYQVSLAPVITEYMDETAIVAVIEDEQANPIAEKTVFYAIKAEGSSDWVSIGSALTNISGVAVLHKQFDQTPGNYSLRAFVNNQSLAISYLLLKTEPLFWYGINFSGQFRNNPGAANYTKLTTTVLVLDNENNPVPALDFELWYTIDGTLQRIPHIFTTNSSGEATIVQGIANLEPGFYQASHFFQPLDYVEGYVGSSGFGNTTVAKGALTLEFLNHVGKWHENLTISSRVTTLSEPWPNLLVEFYYLQGESWTFLGSAPTNSTGYASILWPWLPLGAGEYKLQAIVPESTLFVAIAENATLFVDRAPVSLYVIKEGALKGNGEVLEVEYLENFNFLFFACFDDGSPAANIVITIKGRLLDDLFYTTLGYSITNATGYAIYSGYHYLDLVGNEYLFRAEIAENNQYEEEVLYFKVLLVKCNPIIYFTDHLCEKGTATELIAQMLNIDGRFVKNARVVFNVNGELFSTRTDNYGFARMVIAPEFSVGRYAVICQVEKDNFFAASEQQADLIIAKGRPQFTLYDAATAVGGLLTIRVLARDLLERPIANLTVLLTIQSWNQYLTTDEEGRIEYTFQTNGLKVGTYLSFLTFNGNENWFDVTKTGSVLIYQEESEVELLTTALIATYQETVRIEGVLRKQNGAPLSNRLIQVVLQCSNGSKVELGANWTDGNGRVCFTFTADLLPESYDLGLAYAGALDFGPSSSYSSFLVERAPSELFGEDFIAIIDSTTSGNVTLKNWLGGPIVSQSLEVYIWLNNSWLYLGSYITDHLGVCKVGLYIPFPIGTYTMRVAFAGNAFYLESSIEVTLEVIEAPPQIIPQINVILEKPTVVTYEQLFITLQAQNAYPGSSLVIQLYVNGIYNGTFILHEGLGSCQWAAAQAGLYNLTFVVKEDALYLTAKSEVFVEVKENRPPTLVGYTYETVICIGEPFVVEVAFFDDSGLATCWLTLNGTRYDLLPSETVYNATIRSLQKGYYIITFFAEDQQGYLAIYQAKELIVIDGETQLVKYNLNAHILEIGQEFNFEALIYSETTIKTVYLILNATEYLMTKLYQYSQHQSSWTVAVPSLSLGRYSLAIKIIEENDETTIDYIKETLLVIPNAPALSSLEWHMESSQGSDHLTGTIVVLSFYAIENITLWIDGQPINAEKHGETTYSFEAYVAPAKSHLLKIKVVDSKGNTLLKEIVLGETNAPTALITSIVLAVLFIVSLMIMTFFLATKRSKRSLSAQEEPLLLDVPEVIIEDEEEGGVESTPSVEPTQARTSSKRENRSRKRSKKEPEGNNLPPVSACVTLLEGETDGIDEGFPELDLPAQPLLAEVKDYVEKVKEDGLLQTRVNGSNGKEQKSIEDLSTLSIEIDQRLLPEKELLERKAEQEKLKSTGILSLKEIAEEIEQTFNRKNKS